MKTNSVVEIRDAQFPNNIDNIRQLWTAYLTWGHDKMQMHYGSHPHNPEETVHQHLELIAKFLPSNGRIMLAFIDGNAC